MKAEVSKTLIVSFYVVYMMLIGMVLLVMYVYTSYCTLYEDHSVSCSIPNLFEGGN